MTEAVIVSIVASVVVVLGLSIWTLNSGKQSAARIQALEAAVRAEKAQHEVDGGITPSAFRSVDLSLSPNTINELGNQGYVIPGGNRPTIAGVRAFYPHKPDLSALMQESLFGATEQKPERDKV